MRYTSGPKCTKFLTDIRTKSIIENTMLTLSCRRAAGVPGTAAGAADGAASVAGFTKAAAVLA